MITSTFPILVIPSFDVTDSTLSSVVTKGLISSLLRSLFGGQIALFRNREIGLFKVEQKKVNEMFTPVSSIKESSWTQQKAIREFLFGLDEIVKPEARQWVIVAHSGSLALRNVDHLIPPGCADPYGSPEVDFYWARAGDDNISNYSVSIGLWAVRGEYLPLVLEALREEWSKVSGSKPVDEEIIWTRVVQQLPLRKRAFERGEVVAPRIGAVDWEAVSNAAFVTVPDWPEKEAWKFLQALYFGTYLGDETGLMLNILEA